MSSGALAIIRKKDRTQEDLEKAFRILYHSDGTVTRKFTLADIPDFNTILDNLQFLSKSRLNACHYCPFQFKCNYIVKCTLDNRTRIMIDGLNLHFANETIWNKKLKPKDFIDLGYNTDTDDGINSVYKLIWDKYLEIIPKGQDTKFVLKMAANFCWFETERINGIYNELGKSREIIERYVFPVANELKVENYSNNLIGIIDRIDRTTNDVFAMVEYKYGKPKYFSNQYHKSAINREIGFYALLMQGDNVAVVQDDETLLPIEDVLGFKPEFYYGAMLFFQDINKTRELVKINSHILRSVQQQIDRYWERLNKGMFKPIPKDACFEWCGYYWDLCEFNPRWLEIEHVMDED